MFAASDKAEETAAAAVPAGDDAKADAAKADAAKEAELSPDEKAKAASLTAAIKAFDKATAASTADDKAAEKQAAAPACVKAAAAIVTTDKSVSTANEKVVKQVHADVAASYGDDKPKAYNTLYEAIAIATEACATKLEADLKAAGAASADKDELKKAAEAANKADKEDITLANVAVEAMRQQDAFLGCGPGVDNLCGVRITRACGWF